MLRSSSLQTAAAACLEADPGIESDGWEKKILLELLRITLSGNA